MSNARSIGAVTLIEPGCLAYSRDRQRATATDIVPLGGIVVAVHEHTDRETGEIRRAFLCLEHTETRRRLIWIHLDEHEIDRELVEVADSRTIVRAWRDVATHVANSRSRKGPALIYEARAIDTIHRLASIVFGPEGDLHALMRPGRLGAEPEIGSITEREPSTLPDPSNYVD